MSETIRCFFCRSLFLLSCVLPTAMIVHWILFPTSPADWERELSQQLGVRAEIQSISTPTPHTTVISGLRVADLGFEHQLSIPSLTVTQTDQGTFALLENVDAEVQTVSPLLLQIARRLVQGPAVGRSAHARMQCARIRNGQMEQLLTDVKIDVESTPTGIVVWVQADIDPSASGGASGPISFSLKQQWSESQTAVVSLDTGSHALPCWLLEFALPRSRSLGQDCTFVGKAVFQQSTGGQSARLAGRFENVDMNPMVASPFGQRIAGMADIEIRSCEMIDGRIEELNGVFHCSRGVVGGALLRTIQSAMGMASPVSVDTDEIEFRGARFAFRIGEGRLFINGDTRGVLATDSQDRPLLICANGRAHAVTSLITALAPQHPSGTVLTTQTADLLGYLPLPSAADAARVAKQPDQPLH